jgi:hypothetical protein
VSTVAERVAAGAAFLDEQEPGWDKRVDPNQLDIGASCKCPLGQLHGSYSDGLLSTGILDLYGTSADIDHGFMWASRDRFEDVRAEIFVLTAEWKRVITERRAAQ